MYSKQGLVLLRNGVYGNVIIHKIEHSGNRIDAEYRPEMHDFMITVFL